MAQTHGKNQLNKLPPFTLALVIISFLLVAGFAGGILWPKYNNVQSVKEERIAKKLSLKSKKNYSLSMHRHRDLQKRSLIPNYLW